MDGDELQQPTPTARIEPQLAEIVRRNIDKAIELLAADETNALLQRTPGVKTVGIVTRKEPLHPVVEAARCYRDSDDPSSLVGHTMTTFNRYRNLVRDAMPKKQKRVYVRDKNDDNEPDAQALFDVVAAIGQFENRQELLSRHNVTVNDIRQHSVL